MKQALVSMDLVLTFLFQKQNHLLWIEGLVCQKSVGIGAMHSRLIVKSTVTATDQEKESWCSSCCCKRKTCCLLEPGLPLMVACHHHPIQLIFANQNIDLTWELISGSKVMSPRSERPHAPPKVTQSLLSLYLHAHTHYFEPFRLGFYLIMFL